MNQECNSFYDDSFTPEKRMETMTLNKMAFNEKEKRLDTFTIKKFF